MIVNDEFYAATTAWLRVFDQQLDKRTKSEGDDLPAQILALVDTINRMRTFVREIDNNGDTLRNNNASSQQIVGYEDFAGEVNRIRDLTGLPVNEARILTLELIERHAGLPFSQIVIECDRLAKRIAKTGMTNRDKLEAYGVQPAEHYRLWKHIRLLANGCDRNAADWAWTADTVSTVFSQNPGISWRRAIYLTGASMIRSGLNTEPHTPTATLFRSMGFTSFFHARDYHRRLKAIENGTLILWSIAADLVKRRMDDYKIGWSGALETLSTDIRDLQTAARSTGGTEPLYEDLLK